ncbi:unnamed protein product [Clonostachys byssicola]|uniref:DUF7924 domain-containing protein n=1 Tax=Clonostachys byssicola TaxID=160290 RepID=A0A9N9UPL3_9HYPO|nr:unnamed protein product [Clonostachys byssicola]
MVPHCQTTQPKGRSDIKKQEHPEEHSPQGDSPSIGCKRQHPEEPPPQDNSPSISCKRQRGDLARFARHGGPDLRDLRGYPHPAISHQLAGNMGTPSQRRGLNATELLSLPDPATTRTSKSSSPYVLAFQGHLAEHQIHALDAETDASQEPELAEIIAALNKPRPSLSHSLLSPADFKLFTKYDSAAQDESDVLANVIPAIIGQKAADPLPARETLFNNLKPLTDGTIVSPKPDIYFGAGPGDLHKSIRDELTQQIIPSKNTNKPLAPNFFIEVKGPEGSQGVVTRQACYYGAIGCRAIHSLQNYNQEQPVYDGKPYAFSTTYQSGGSLKLFAHHVTAPTTTEGLPEYHMTKVYGWDVTANLENLRTGITGFRNARDLAKQYRDRFIQEANDRRSQALGHGLSAAHGSGDPTSCILLQDAHDGQLQQHVDEGEGTSQDPVLPGDAASLSLTPCSPSSPSPPPHPSKRRKSKA